MAKPEDGVGTDPGRQPYRQIAVAKQYLDGTQIGACFEHVRREAMTQSVRRDMLVDTCALTPPPILQPRGLDDAVSEICGDIPAFRILGLLACLCNTCSSADRLFAYGRRRDMDKS